jgi:CheY-like chemotaxis protein
MMPEMSGYDLLKSIRNNNEIRNNNVPFIFLTALGQRDDIIKGINLSANDYMIKPIDFDLLVAIIKEKASNVIKAKKVHLSNIENIKKQYSDMLPTQLTQYIDNITRISRVLKDEPYGPFPHRKYAEDLEKIYINSNRLKAVIKTVLDGSVVSTKLDVNDKIIDPIKLVKNAVAKIDQKYAKIISFEYEYELQEIKIDEILLLKVIKAVIGRLFRANSNSQIDVSVMLDHLDQMIIIFTTTTKKSETDSKAIINNNELNAALEKQGCICETRIRENDLNQIIYIPKYRVKKS